VSRMKDKQETIFYMAGSSKEEVEQSPFVERLLKKGYEVLYLTEAVDEYAISALPEFEGNKCKQKPVCKGTVALDLNLTRVVNPH
jgi:heat shock protein beta